MPENLFGYIWRSSGRHQLGLNVYRAWVSERAVLQLRRRIGALTASAVAAEDRAMAEGVEISMILSESEPIGGFVGVSLSEPLLQGGILFGAREGQRPLGRRRQLVSRDDGGRHALPDGFGSAALDREPEGRRRLSASPAQMRTAVAAGLSAAAWSSAGCAPGNGL